MPQSCLTTRSLPSARVGPLRPSLIHHRDRQYLSIRGRADQAARLIEVRCTAADPGRVAQLVLGELVWVLTRAYGDSKAQVVSALEQVLVVIAELTVEGESLAFHAPHAFRVKAAPVDLPRRTLTDGVELAAWLKEAERRIRDKLADGPVVV